MQSITLRASETLNDAARLLTSMVYVSVSGLDHFHLLTAVEFSAKPGIGDR